MRVGAAPHFLAIKKGLQHLHRAGAKQRGLQVARSSPTFVYSAAQ
jgi:hypothetical protein